jgi:4-hydroxybenzoyl-CoA thioesterase
MAYVAQLKIRFGGIDRAGIVYYPKFMHYFHIALEGLPRNLFVSGYGR